jgi:hypothetical protein
MLTIRTYGHFWSRELIDWGWQNKKGTLPAATKPGSDNWEVDFREQVGIYALFNDTREVVYIGQTGYKGQKLFARLKQHSRGQLRDRWTNFSWFGFLVPDKEGKLVQPDVPKSKSDDNSSEANLEHAVKGSVRDALNEIEAVLIQIVEPRLNKQGPSWSGAKEYFQFDPFDAEPSPTELMEAIKSIGDKLGVNP